MLPDPESFRSVVSGVPVGGNGDDFRRGRRWVWGWWVVSGLLALWVILDDGGHAFGGFSLGMNENGSSTRFI